MDLTAKDEWKTNGAWRLLYLKIYIHNGCPEEPAKRGDLKATQVAKQQ